MTDKILLTGSKIIPELFKMIADREEAALLMAMPGTPEQLSEKVDKSTDEVEKMCQELYHKGLAFKSFKTGTLGYKMCRDIVQFHDATILWPEAPKAYHDLWQKFMEEEWSHFARLIEQFLPKPFTRVIPVEKSIDIGKQQILDADSVNRIIESAEALAVTRCTCRVIAHKCDKPLEVCLQVNNAAKYTLDRGTGREVTKNEALEILRDCEEKGLVHITMNKAHVGHFICNCCDCCCQTLPMVISEGLKICDPSRYLAMIDAEHCSFCGTCQERCYFNAIEETETENGKEAMNVLADKCMGCGLCQIACPEEAINMKEVRSADFIPA
ncbi:MAG: 4Fe-4S binding protein [Deltaproteobacteria bacterium]|jgi:NAD-dependent dihydropyrimidine dehydrogenase PreA subunit|nr:4Fe-4S binding protein [Deltaproteobacteria bacterium]